MSSLSYSLHSKDGCNNITILKTKTKTCKRDIKMDEASTSVEMNVLFTPE
jgi:hypothetical protein